MFNQNLFSWSLIEGRDTDSYVNGIDTLLFVDLLISLGPKKAKENSDEKYEDLLKNKIDGYVDGFTVHGLTRVFKSPRHESVFWLFVLIGGLLLAVIVLYTLITKYYDFEIYTEIRSVVTERNTFPSLSICDMSLLTTSYFHFCGSHIKALKDNDTSICDYEGIEASFHNNKIPGKSADNTSWSNGLFDVFQCYSWDGERCISSQYFKTHPRLKHSCITWNYDGKMSDSYGHVTIELGYKASGKRPPKIIAIPHDHRITEVDMTRKVNLDPRKSYEINIQKTYTKRLEHPYPSRCASEKDAQSKDMTPGAYSRRTCLESFQMLEAYKKCGAIFDYFHPFVPLEIKAKYQQNKTVGEMKKCIVDGLNSAPSKASLQQCPFPCDELDVGISSTFNEWIEADEMITQQDTSYVYNINLQLQSIDSYTAMEEKPLYSADQMACEIGGFLGLVMGASFLSFIEIFFCSSLLMVKKWYSRKNQ